ncbi:Histone-lysine N-methyltransferase, H3 lysine-36 specific,Histone-lysine N-methyltransferase, H3 lysine-36 and H4 lysine-20 specific,Histone-lysine N-methyltransferase SETD2,Probable histone-lysine N-methyltransferase CG1716,Histone-lysine N-methyltransferase ASH1L,Histone-lysine N-methyltransferase NSD2,Histone-lysine N-methyltransferase ASHH2,Probable histone-lysine N-methyltransferase Mes-4,Histone-lysine N-methyltransferase NSD3 [Lepeophtheirus salmonis]|uniref:Histone-lysine N-methyltransferase NSD2 n=1 Tax=Lepeophtheirus salmonis TaxID=72036 RepID=A0A7R8D0M0_LEPSM|nr:Histone-lysine N-methyltransferase, H3 lysine-36 specific,Histone-lysine N-methyltransferase, H3 lysine-36 and H4 lysine-20 specific,Histone-lysine N-methyltransferase SETD2,Probable histone-lysine N-methyltransferase CG1716,Histone-lysine N-methyltransferase ASH1L,Histone-lysine N-methyltransferase NSD2,Histone-lysine N-methyltransferase ASHH2,Probable histone-lysine N-methyltransferase Mes-4,Histone-lysine N-methyltransferase NSD3 [Lepeophtheirus salmonis]CAF2985274.1 Histone-lysine N-methylt
MCHTCASDNISNPVMKYSAKLLKCVRCPTSYHSGDYCVAAGTIQITSTAIICPKHTSNNNFTNSKSINNVSKKGSSKHINVSWCFICSSGGSLICCDFCPASFHSECLNLPNLPEGKYYCQTCCNGRMPLYREVVWVKLGAYRWWPAAVVHPSELPENVNRLNHQTGDFPVKFCGSNEYSWVSHGRTFLYEKGDSDKMPEGSFCSKKSITESFRKGLVEAAEIHLHYLGAKTKREAKNVQKKPPLYQKIKTNRPYGDVPVYTDASSEVQVCNCDHKSENPCNEDSDCINRMLMVECQMSTCPAKDRCRNMQFQRRSYPPLRVAYTESRGWGLFVDKPIKKGRFIIEYVGDLITMEEFRNRLRKSQAAKEDENFYYMTMDSNRMIDAGPKGNIARFMNHSCDPNCETQKWTVNGDTRVGIFTLKDIPANTELTFNYKFEAVGEVKKTCLCGAVNCSGYIGKKPASLKNNGEVTPRSSQSKKKVKKFKLIKAWEDVCFRCYKGGEVLMCDHKTCPKVYHLACLSRDKMPHGRWFCPWHHCVECGKSAVSYCVHCPNAYCKNHEATLVEHSLLKNICNEHDEEDINSLVNYYKSEDGSVRKMLTSPAAPMKKSSDEDTQSSSESSNAINEVAVKSKDQSQKSDLDKTASEETATTNTTLTQKPFNNGVSVPKGKENIYTSSVNNMSAKPSLP